MDIPDVLYRRLKSRAAVEGRSVKELILRGVRVELGEDEPKGGVRVKLPIVHSKKPGSVRLDNARIYEIIPFP